MALLLKESQSNIECGLGTFQFTVATAGYFLMNALCNENPPSGITIAIQLNGSTLKSSIVVGTTQQELNVRQDNIKCAVNDVLSFVISSSAANDQGLNTVKTTMIVTRVG